MSAIKHEPRVLIYVNEQWVDITRQVRVDQGIEIFHGQRDESKNLNPAWCRLTLDNRTGDFTPRNPMSPYAGYLNKNTPICVVFDEITDDFNRTVVNAWGDTTTGETYSDVGTGGSVAADWQVNGTQASHRVTAGGEFRRSALNTSDAPYTRNMLQKVRFTVPFTNVTGAAIEPGNLIARVSAVGNHYICRLTINTDESVSLAIHSTIDGELAAPVTVPGVTHTSSQGIWVKFAAIDNDIMATAWVGDDDEDEPTDWLVTATDDNFFLRFGWFGIRTGVTVGNTNIPVTISYDHYQAWVAEFCGDISDFPQEYSDDAVDALVPIEAAGITRRLIEGGPPLVSSARRYYESFGSALPDWYWPLDDGELSEVGRATRRPEGYGPEDVAFHFNYDISIDPDSANVKHFAQGKLNPWLPNGVILLADNVLFQVLLPSGSANISPLNQNWAIDWTWRGGSNVETNVVIGGYHPNGTVDAYTIHISEPDREITIFYAGDLVTTMDTDTLYGLQGINIFDGKFHQFRFRVFTTGGGADISFFLNIDGSSATSGTNLAETFLISIGVIYFSNPNINPDPKEYVIAHAALFISETPSTSQAATYNAVNGEQGEVAEYRFGRLCDQEGVEHFIDLDDPNLSGAEIGPQYTDKLMDQLFEVVRTDGGLMREYPDARALAILLLEDLRALSAVLTLDVGAGELAPKFKPVDDTQRLKNQIRAVRRDGGDYTHAQITGRLGTADPKLGGAGVYAGGDIKVNPYNDQQLVSIAEREVSRGTIDKARFPDVSVNLIAPEVTSNLALRRSILDAKVGTRIVLTNMQEMHIYEDADLLVIGRSQFFTNHEHTITWNTIPYNSFDVFRVETPGSIIGTDSSTIVSAIDDNDTSCRVVTEGQSLWTTDPTYHPITARIGIPPSGEDVSVTNVVTTAPGFRSVGSVSHVDNGSTSPGLPAGHQSGDTLVLVTVIRDSARTANVPSGYTAVNGTNHLKICVKTSTGGSEVAPTCTYSAGAAGDTCSSFIMAFTDSPFDYTDAVYLVGATGNAQDIVFPAASFPRSNGIEILIGWKADDYTSVTPPSDLTEIVEASTTVGLDQSLYACYREVETIDESPVRILSVSGGGSADTKGFVLYFSNPQVLTLTRSLNEVIKSWPADTAIRIAYPKPLG